VYVSRDLGETWIKVVEMDPAVADAAWIDRDGVAALLLATDVGLYEVTAAEAAVPLQVRVDDTDSDRGFYAVRSFVSEHGVAGVALAAQAQYGIYLSLVGGRPGTFTKVGLNGVDTRMLAVQLDGPATVLWAGAAEADAGKPGRGCFRARLFEADVSGRRCPPAGPAAPAGPWTSPDRPPTPPPRAAACCTSTPVPRRRSGRSRPSTAACRCGTGPGSSRSRRSRPRPGGRSRRHPQGRVPADRHPDVGPGRQPDPHRPGHRAGHLVALLGRPRRRGGA
jgi:hypothetical protein